MSFLSFITDASASSPPQTRKVRQIPTARRSSSDGITPAQILQYLKESEQFHVGRFKESYVYDGIVLGKGSFGCVRRCFSAHSSEKGGVRYFAAKEIRYGTLKKSEVMDVLSEVACLRKLNHQHIVHLKEAWLDGPNAILIEELLEGIDGFAAVLEKGKVDDIKCKDILWQLTSAVAYCHSKKIVHRDIKLENVMLVGPSRSHVKLVDFGLAIQLQEDTGEDNASSGRVVQSESISQSLTLDRQLSRFCGTPHYMAPEIVHRQLYGRPVDVWALGVLLYILISGETLWEDGEPKHVIKQVKQNHWEFDQCEVWSRQPRSVKDLVSSMLNPKPEARMTAFSVCCADWLHSTQNMDSSALSPRSPNHRLSASSIEALSSMRSTPIAADNSAIGVSAPMNAQDGVVYSQATMRSSTFQSLLTSPGSETSSQKARLSLLAKREYLHLHVSQLVNFCSEPPDEHRSVEDTNSILTYLLGTAVAMARKLTNAERGSLFIVVSDPTVDNGVPHLWSKVSEGAKPIRVKLGVGIAGSVAETGDSVNVADAYNDPHFDHCNDDESGFRTKSVLCAPIPHGDPDRSLIGVVQLINRQPDVKQSNGGIWPQESTPFSDEDEELLQDFCIHLGMGLTRFISKLGNATNRGLFSRRSSSVSPNSSRSEGHQQEMRDPLSHPLRSEEYSPYQTKNTTVRLGQKRSPKTTKSRENLQTGNPNPTKHRSRQSSHFEEEGDDDDEVVVVASRTLKKRNRDPLEHGDDEVGQQNTKTSVREKQKRRRRKKSDDDDDDDDDTVEVHDCIDDDEEEEEDDEIPNYEKPLFSHKKSTRRQRDVTRHRHSRSKRISHTPSPHRKRHIAPPAKQSFCSIS